MRQISLSLRSCEVSYIAFCSGQQQGARRRRHLNNPVCSWSSRAKAHCPDGNRNILEMKWPHLFPEPRVEFWRGFSLVLSRHHSGLTHHPRLPFLLDLHSASFLVCFFGEDEEGLELHNWRRRRLSVAWSDVCQTQRGGARWALRHFMVHERKNWKKNHHPWDSYNTPPNITVQSHRKNIYYVNKLVLVANKLNEFKLSR